MNNISPTQSYEKFDSVADKVPVISTVTNLFYLTMKLANICKCVPSKSALYQHITNKETYKCALLLIPVLGNIAVALIDHCAKKPKEKIDLQPKKAKIKEDATVLDPKANDSSKSATPEENDDLSHLGEKFEEGQPEAESKADEQERVFKQQPHSNGEESDFEDNVAAEIEVPAPKRKLGALAHLDKGAKKSAQKNAVKDFIDIQIKKLDSRTVKFIVSNQALSQIGKSCPNITTLLLLNTEKHPLDVTNETLRVIAENFPNLTKLALNAPNIDNDGLAHIGRLQKLQKLLISACPKISDQGLEHLKKLKKLEKVNLVKCDQISPVVIQSFNQQKQAIEVVQV